MKLLTLCLLLFLVGCKEMPRWTSAQETDSSAAIIYDMEKIIREAKRGDTLIVHILNQNHEVVVVDNYPQKGFIRIRAANGEWIYCGPELLEQYDRMIEITMPFKDYRRCK